MNGLDWLLCAIPGIVIVIVLIILSPDVYYHEPETVWMDGIEDQENIISAGELVEQRRHGYELGGKVVLIYEETEQMDYSAELNLRSVKKKGEDVNVFTQEVTPR